MSARLRAIAAILTALLTAALLGVAFQDALPRPGIALAVLYNLSNDLQRPTYSLLGAALLVGLTPALMAAGARRWWRRRAAPTLRLLRARVPAAAPLPGGSPGQSAREAGVTLVVGPDRTDAGRLAAQAAAAGRDVLLVGDDRAEASARRHATTLGCERRLFDALTFLPAPTPEAEIRGWLAAAALRGAAATIVVDGAQAVGGWLLAERAEARLARLIDGLRGPLERGGAQLVLVERLASERALALDPIGATLQRRIDTALLCDQGALVAAADAPQPVGGWLVRGGQVRGADDARNAQRAASAGALALYLLAAALLCGPVILGTSDGTLLLGPASGGDLPGSLWSNWWVYKAISSGAPWEMFQSPDVFWPVGDNLIVRFGNLVVPLLSVPFQALGEYPGYWNVFVGAAILCNGLAARALAREVGASLLGSAVAGLLFCTAPAVLVEVASGSQSVFFAAPLAIAIRAGLRALDGERPKDAWRAAAWLVFAGLCWWFYSLFAIAVVGAAAVHRAIRDRRADAERQRTSTGLWLIRFGIPALLAAGPLLALANSATLPGLLVLDPVESLASLPAGDVMLTGLLHRSRPPLSLLVGAPEADGLAGGATALLLLAAVLVTRGRRWFWPGVALVSAALATGPLLRPIEGWWDEWLTLPWATLYTVVPFLSRLQQPDRLLILSALSVALVAGLLLTRLTAALPRRGRTAAGLAALLAVALLPTAQGTAVLPTREIEPPSWLVLLPDEGAIIEIPLGNSQDALLNQPLHGLPIMNGPGEFRELMSPGPFVANMEGNSLLRFLALAESSGFDEAGLADAYDRGLRFIVVHDRKIRDLVEADSDTYTSLINLASQIESVFGPPFYREKGLRIYRLPRSVSSGAGACRLVGARPEDGGAQRGCGREDGEQEAPAEVEERRGQADLLALDADPAARLGAWRWHLSAEHP